MKKNYAASFIATFTAFALFFTSCKKELRDGPGAPQDQTSSRLDNGHDGDNKECRLIFGTNKDPSGSANFTFHYNSKGLADEWNIENYGLFKQEYDAGGRLKKAGLWQGGQVSFTVQFFYNGSSTKVWKELLYFGATNNLMDEIFYYYDVRGNLVKVQSVLSNWVAYFAYSAEGSLTRSDLLFGGFPVYTAIYQYNKPVKNPYLAVPGIDHLYPYYTPADLFYGKWRFASLKQLA